MSGIPPESRLVVIDEGEQMAAPLLIGWLARASTV